MADLKVKEVQQWLNDTFPSYFKYDEEPQNCGTYPIEPDGITGTRTVKALIMAIQIHYNLTPVDGIWGNATSAACVDIKSGVTDSTIIRIAQGGFYCKGYAPGGFDGIFGNNLGNAIQSFKADLGITTSKVMEPDVFKALLNTDPTVLVSSGDNMVRAVQQYLNRNYYNLFKSKLGYLPTGGIYERKTSKALIYAFQKIIETTADGVIGDNTFNAMPSIEQGCSNSNLVTILQAALICNGYNVSLDGVYDEDIATQVTAFQNFMCLDNDSQVVLGKVNRRTWGALLWSKGDTSRTPNAGDCRQQLDYAKAVSLYNDGFRYIGRYLTKVQGGNDKNITPTEIENILLAGLKIFPIFQEDNDSLDDFTYVSGYLDGYNAIMTATELLIPPGTTIYFAVDYDALEDEVKTSITEYFQGINQAKADVGSTYNIGIYSARNTCSIICNQELATSSFVSDMSSGYSGNLGFTMPENWAYDQYYELKNYVADDNSVFDLDKVIASDDAPYFDVGEIVEPDYWSIHKNNIGLYSLQVLSNDAVLVNNIVNLIEQLEDAYWEYNSEGDYMECVFAVLHYLWKEKYTSTLGFSQTLEENNPFINYVKTNSDYTNLVTQIAQYISGTYKLLKDADVLSEIDSNGNEYSYSRMFELPHLAVIISAYLENVQMAKREWYGWAGDLVTGINEVDIVAANNPGATVNDHARDRIGKMEVLATNNPHNLTVTNEVQMNYCDFYADMDAIGIATVIRKLLVQNVDKTHVLSEAISLYYTSYYKKRCSYWLNDFKPGEYSISELKQALVDYLNAPEQIALITLKMNSVNDATIEACCESFAELIMHDRKCY